jgi:integrase
MPLRRAAGEGSIYEIKSGRYKGQFASALTISRPGEPRRRRVFRGKRREEVRQKLLAAQRDGVGVQSAPARETIAGLLEAFIVERSSRVKPKTIKQYRDVARLHIEPFIGAKRVRDFTPDDADAFLAEIRRRGRSAQMQRLARIVLAMAWKLAVRRRRVLYSPLDAVDPIAVPRKRMTTWSEEEVRAFLGWAAGDRYERLFVLALTVGMREGELLGLRRSDVNVREGALFIQETAHETAGSVSAAAAKTAGSRRRIDLPAIAIAAVRAQIKAVMADEATADSPWLFPDTDGGAFAARNLRQRHFRRIADRCACGHDAHPAREKTKARKPSSGRCTSCACRKYKPAITRIRFHDLRHTFATLALANGVPVKVVSEILGHSSIKVTLDYYGHVTSGMQRAATITMNGVFARIVANPLATSRRAKGP